MEVQEECLWLGGRRNGAIEINISMVLAAVSGLLCPSGGPGYLRLCPFGCLGGLASGGCLFWCAHWEKEVEAGS